MHYRAAVAPAILLVCFDLDVGITAPFATQGEQEWLCY